MVDLVVVGGGYWGIACAHFARARGDEVIVVDDGNPQGAARNSAGIFSAWWYKAETSAHRIPEHWDWTGPSVDWLVELGLVTPSGEYFANYKTLPNMRYKDDCWLVPPREVLSLVPTEQGKVVSLVRSSGGHWLVRLSDGSSLRARKVIIAAGAWTDSILLASGLETVGVRPLRGRAAILDFDATMIDPTPITIFVGPFAHMTYRPWYDGLWRLGDTVEKKNPSTDRVTKALAYGRELDLPESKVVDWLDGLRPDREAYFCEMVRPGLVVATGGHRVGLGLSEPVARRAMELLA